MDERLSGWEDRLRLELDASVRGVRADDGLVVAAREGGRRRVRRRRALVTLPAAVVVVGGAVWAGVSRQGAPVNRPITPAGSAPATTGPAPVVATTPPVLTMGEQSAIDTFYGAGYTFDDAVELGQLWNVTDYEAKSLAGQALFDGDVLPIDP